MIHIEDSQRLPGFDLRGSSSTSNIFCICLNSLIANLYSLDAQKKKLNITNCPEQCSLNDYENERYRCLNGLGPTILFHFPEVHLINRPTLSPNDQIVFERTNLILSNSLLPYAAPQMFIKLQKKILKRKMKLPTACKRIVCGREPVTNQGI